MQTDRADDLSSIYVPLRLIYGLVPIVAGLDKFANLLTNWERYLPPALARTPLISATSFMRVVGVIEIVAGLAVLTAFTRLGAYVVMAWLALIAATLIAAGHFDIAVRDLVMAAGAYTLARVAGLRNEPWIPAAHKTQTRAA